MFGFPGLGQGVVDAPLFGHILGGLACLRSFRRCFAGSAGGQNRLLGFSDCGVCITRGCSGFGFFSGDLGRVGGGLRFGSRRSGLAQFGGSVGIFEHFGAGVVLRGLI
ncbi:hypothetical protein D3C79_976890 [compost metagenome]